MRSRQADNTSASRSSDKLGVRLTELTDEQAEYINMPKERPYKPEYYRY